MSLKQTHTFIMDYQSDIDQRQYNGTFSCTRMNVLARSKISIRRSQLCGGMYCVRDDEGKPTGQGIDEETEGLNYMFAVLEVLLVQKPEWFKLEDITDESVIIQAFKEVMSFDNSFRAGRRATTEENGTVGSNQGASASESKKSDNLGAPKKVVDPEIHAALDA